MAVTHRFKGAMYNCRRGHAFARLFVCQVARTALDVFDVLYERVEILLGDLDEGQMGKEPVRKRGREAEKQRERQSDKASDRETERQGHTHTHTYRYIYI